MKRLLILAAFVLSCGLLSAQTVTGKVTDGDTGEPLEGVAVVVKGTTVGVLSGADGMYSLRLPDNASSLIFNFVGKKTIDEPLNGRTTINVTMEEDVLQIDEVVVTAIGLEANKKSVGYAIQNVDASEILQSREVNLVNALNGKVAGVTVVSSSGSPGASANIRIRGSVSINGSNDPLFVIDGVPVDNSSSGNGVDGVDNSNRAIDINPNDIESLNVLKGPAATALYGLRAANGAVIITTKSGKQGAPKVTFRAGFTADEVNKLPQLQNQFAQGRPTFEEDPVTEELIPLGFTYRGPETFEGFSWGPAIADLEYDGATDYPFDKNGRLVPTGQGNGTPAQAYDPYSFFVTGQTWDLNASVQGGTDKLNYYLSAGRLTSNGVVPNSLFERNSFRTRLQAQVTKKLSIGMAANYVNSGGNRLQRGSNLRGVMLGLLRNTPTFDIGNGLEGQAAADDPSTYVLADGSQRSYRAGIYDNPYWVVNKNVTQDNVNRIIGYASARYEFTDWLSVSYKLGIDQFVDERNGAIDIVPGWNPGSISNSTQNSRDLNSDLLLTINKNITEDLSLDATFGHNYWSTKVVTKEVLGNTLAAPNFYHISNAADVLAFEGIGQRDIVGLLGTINLGYKEMLYLNLSGRNDWSSALPEGNNSFFAPAASLGFVFTEAFGMSESKVLPYGKLRASWGQVGLDAPLYSTANYYNSAVNSGDGFLNPDGLQYPAFGISAFERGTQLGNPNLSAELTTTFEIGAELKFLDNRLGLDVTYYSSTSNGQIIAIDLPASTGFTNYVINAGVISNRGIEGIINLSPVRSRDFRWDIDVNFTAYENTVEELSDGVENIFLAGFTSTSSRVIAGQPYGALFGSGFQKDTLGNTLIGDNGWPLQSPDIGFQGDPNPDWIAGIRNTFTFKGFRLSALLDIRQGGDIWCGTCGVMNYFGTTQQSADERNNPNVVFEGVKADGTPNTTEVNLVNPNDPSGVNGFYWVRYGFGGIAEMTIEDGSWIRLRELTLSYTVPSSVLENLPFSAADITLSGRNLWLSTNYPGIDPETNLTGSSNGFGLDYFNMPNTRSYGASLNLTF
jgi:TonB-linked SusC/RagA family outer membrane protein